MLMYRLKERERVPSSILLYSPEPICDSSQQAFSNLFHCLIILILPIIYSICYYSFYNLYTLISDFILFKYCAIYGVYAKKWVMEGDISRSQHSCPF